MGVAPLIAGHRPDRRMPKPDGVRKPVGHLISLELLPN